jgi:hypothetical protein
MVRDPAKHRIRVILSAVKNLSMPPKCCVLSTFIGLYVSSALT